jgi:UDP-N-acetylmuramoyl-tripeptide--D-alanyl-D-alanine ligase
LSAIRGGDAVMIKGSLGSRMGPIVKALQRLSARQNMSETGASRNGTLRASAQG